MVPAEVVYLDKLPVLGTGKIDMVGVAKLVKERGRRCAGGASGRDGGGAALIARVVCSLPQKGGGLGRGSEHSR